MISVPKSNVVRLRQGEMPSETDLLMAAATMHDLGRLFEKPEKLQTPLGVPVERIPTTDEEAQELQAQPDEERDA